ncbi:MAG TPA: TetR/AcrR family transcriptional regulator [Verrucomicrobiae bacterium]|jgi:AcrR family transcriptional regulator|nr:TetR/AcrR family transcriptional regulator [Verrucomicrobiae bacterium]
MERQPMVRAGTADRIIDAAEAIVEEHGVAALTLEQAAKRAGVSKGGVLYHFPSKEALVAAMIGRFTQRFDNAVAQMTTEDSSAKGRTTRSYVKASFGHAPGTGPKFDRACGSITAALANNPGNLAVVREQSARWQRAVEADGLDPVFASIIRLAVDGLWLGENFNLMQLNPRMRAKIEARLIAWTKLRDLPAREAVKSAAARTLPPPRLKSRRPS